MFLRLFKGYQAFVLLLIPLVGILLWIDSFFIKEFEMHGNYVFMPFSDLIFHILGYNSFVSKLFALILVLVNAFLLVRMNIIYNFIRTRTYFPAFFYILMMSHIREIHKLTPALMASFFIILALNKVLYTFKKEQLAIHIMDASLLVSVASFFYIPSIFMIVYLWIGLILLRPFKWREWVFTFLGLGIPYLIFACILYISGNEIKIPFKELYNVPFILNWSLKGNIFSIVFFIFSSVLIVFASFQMLRLFGTKKVHSRRFFIYFLWLFIITLLIYLIVPSASIEIFYINAISLSFLFSHYFVNLRSGWISEIMFLIFIGIIVANKFIS